MNLNSIFSTILVTLVTVTTHFQAQSSILVVSSANGAKKVVQLSATDGSVINNNFIDLSSQKPGNY